MRKHFLTSLGIVAVLGIGAYWYWSPYLALHDMRNALHERDPDNFNVHVDYPKLRDSLKGQLSALITEEMAAKSDSANEMGRAGTAFGSMLGLALVDRMVDAVVRPEAVMYAMRDGTLKLGRDRQRTDEQLRMAAGADTATLQQALELYKLDHGNYPTQAQGLQILVDSAAVPDAGGRTYLEKLPLDPWGRPYQYHNPGQAPGTVDVTWLPPPVSTGPSTDDSLSWHAERKNADMLIVYADRDDKSAREQTGFVMSREGFARWKLTEIRLPLSRK